MKHFVERLEVKAGFWSLFDQGAVSLGNFFTQLLLARHLNWNEYGVFALIYGVLFFLISSVGTLVTYPLSLKGGSLSSGGLRKLSGISLILGLGLIAPSGLIVFCAAAVLRRSNLFLFAVLALASWQLQETLRRALMARLGHREAAWGDALSYLGQSVVIGFLAKTGHLNLQSAFLAIAATSVAAAVVQIFQVKPLFGGVAECRAVAVEFWRLGGWASGTNLTSGATQLAFPWALGLLLGTAEAGSFQAIVNPLKAFNPLIVGTQNITVPAVAKVQRSWGNRAAARSGLTYAGIGFVLFLPYLIVMIAWPHAVLRLLYGPHSPYSQLELALRVCAPAYAAGYWGEATCSVLNGLGMPRAAFLSQIGASAVAIIVGVPLILAGGLGGAFASLGVCAIIRIVISLYSLWAVARNNRVSALADGVTL